MPVIATQKGNLEDIAQPTEKWRGDKNGETCTVEINLPFATWRDYLPEIGDVLAGFNHMVLETWALDQPGNPLRAVLTLNYTQNGSPGSGGAQAPPPTEYTEEGTPIELRFGVSHPHWSDASAAGYTGNALTDDWDGARDAFDAGSELFGIDTWMAGGGSVNRKEYGSQEFGSVLPLIGGLANPGGGFGYPGQWRIIGGNRGREGAWFYRVLTFQFSATPWSTRIYRQVTA